MNTKGLFDLTESERTHLKVLWHEPQTVVLLKKCFDQQSDILVNELIATPVEEPFRVVQGQIAMLKLLWTLLEKTALQDANALNQTDGEKVPRLI